jgi:hypothetical protein
MLKPVRQILATSKVHQIFTKLLQLFNHQRLDFRQILIRKMISATQMLNDQLNFAFGFTPYPW